MAYFIAAALTYGLALLDVGLGKYANTFGFLIRSGFGVHALALFYAALASVIVLFFDGLVAPALTAANEGRPDFLGFLAWLKNNPMALGIFVGVFGKGLADLQLFSLPTPSSYPIGLRSFTILVDAPLRKRIFIEHYNCVSAFASAEADKVKQKNITDLRDAFVGAVPSDFPARAPTIADFKKAQDALELILKALNRFGRTWTIQALKRV